MRILAIISGEYGRRHVAHIGATAPLGWRLRTWVAPPALPPVLDDPEDYLPPALLPADLLLSLAERPVVAELLPDLARLTGARAVIAAVDNEVWLPRGLARQLRGWLEQLGVACVTPKPLCSLTETSYGAGRGRQFEYSDPTISEFARHFGRPCLRVTADLSARRVHAVEVIRGALCGSTHHVAAGLVGAELAGAPQEAGLLHHHYPCMAGMSMDDDYGDTLMHVSGNIVKDEVAAQVRPWLDPDYIVPRERSE